MSQGAGDAGNWMKINRNHYLFIDTKEIKSRNLFRTGNMRVKEKKILSNGGPYRMVICRYRGDNFEKTMKKLEDEIEAANPGYRTDANNILSMFS